MNCYNTKSPSTYQIHDRTDGLYESKVDKPSLFVNPKKQVKCVFKLKQACAGWVAVFDVGLQLSETEDNEDKSRLLDVGHGSKKATTKKEKMKFKLSYRGELFVSGGLILLKSIRGFDALIY